MDQFVMCTLLKSLIDSAALDLDEQEIFDIQSLYCDFSSTVILICCNEIDISFLVPDQVLLSISSGQSLYKICGKIHNKMLKSAVSLKKCSFTCSKGFVSTCTIVTFWIGYTHIKLQSQRFLARYNTLNIPVNYIRMDLSKTSFILDD